MPQGEIQWPQQERRPHFQLRVQSHGHGLFKGRHAAAGARLPDQQTVQVYLLADCAQHGPPNARSLNFSARWYGQRNGVPSDSEKPLTTAEIPSSGFWDQDVATMPMRHQGTANLVFCDGHVETIHNISELKQKNFYWNY